MSAEMKDLFKHISRYTPQTVELDTKLKPFIPEFIPAIGDIDAFLKVAEIYRSTIISFYKHKIFANIASACKKITLPIIYSTMHTILESMPA